MNLWTDILGVHPAWAQAFGLQPPPPAPVTRPGAPPGGLPAPDEAVLDVYALDQRIGISVWDHAGEAIAFDMEPEAIRQIAEKMLALAALVEARRASSR